MPTESFLEADMSGAVVDSTVATALREVAAKAPEAIGLIEGVPDRDARRRWTWSELLADAERVGRALAGRFSPGENVAIWAPNIPEWVLVEFGAAFAGITLVTVNPAYRDHELSYVLGQSKASGLLYVPEFRGNPMADILEAVRDELPDLREVIDLTQFNSFLDAGPAGRLAEPKPDDPAQIQYTSGTTGFPKGALLSHKSITNNSRLTVERMGLTSDDLWVNPMPMFHTGGCVVATLGPLQKGAGIVLAPIFDPELYWDLVEEESATASLAVPSMLIALLEHPSFGSRDLSKFARMLSGGATVPADLVRRVEKEMGVSFDIIYGQTEASPVITQTKPTDTPEDTSETLGLPLPGTEFSLRDPDTNEVVPLGSMGEICARGYLVMLGYFDKPDATAEAIDADGWLHTGDLGTMDERGYTRIAGRIKEMIIRGGENIYPREVEDLLFGRADVAEVAVVGIPDERWGETVAAFVRSGDGHLPKPEELFAYCREHLAAYKSPTTWIAVESFPTTPSGKIQKFVLRDQLLEGAYADTWTPTSK